MSSLIRVEARGSLPGGDTFQHGLYCVWTDLTIPDDDTLSDIADAVTDGLINTATGLQDFLRPNTVYEPARAIYFSPVDGSTISDAIGTVGGAGVRVGGFSMPNQLACVTTFRCDPDNRHTRGRAYLPALCSVAYDDSGRLTSDAQNAVLISWQKVIDNLDDLAPAGSHVYLETWSQSTLTDHLVTSVEVGDVPDTQRRRTNSMAESRVAIPAVHS